MPDEHNAIELWDQVIEWLTGSVRATRGAHLDTDTTFEEFFDDAR